jgi:hypothetical protein
MTVAPTISAADSDALLRSLDRVTQSHAPSRSLPSAWQDNPQKPTKLFDGQYDAKVDMDPQQIQVIEMSPGNHRWIRWIGRPMANGNENIDGSYPTEKAALIAGLCSADPK